MSKPKNITLSMTSTYNTTIKFYGGIFNQKHMCFDMEYLGEAKLSKTPKNWLNKKWIKKEPKQS
jgi:hypothetical protein